MIINDAVKNSAVRPMHYRNLNEDDYTGKIGKYGMEASQDVLVLIFRHV
jgi:hypothetical protein